MTQNHVGVVIFIFLEKYYELKVRELHDILFSNNFPSNRSTYYKWNLMTFSQLKKDINTVLVKRKSLQQLEIKKSGYKCQID